MGTIRMFTPSFVAGGAKFVCGDSDLDEFFHEDAFLQAGQLLCKNYCFTSDDNPNEVVCAFTLANDSIKKIATFAYSFYRNCIFFVGATRFVAPFIYFCIRNQHSLS